MWVIYKKPLFVGDSRHSPKLVRAVSCQSGVWASVSKGALTGACEWGGGWGTASCPYSGNMTCAAGNNVIRTGYANSVPSGGYMMWSSSGSWPIGLCIRAN